MMVYVGAALVLGLPVGRIFPIGMALASVLIWISIVDFDRFQIPNEASAALTVAGLVQLVGLPHGLAVGHIMAAILWPLLFWMVATGYKRVRGRNGLGFGDVKLIGAIALWVGFEGTATVVLGAALAGATTILVFHWAMRRKAPDLGKSVVAFGPFLCLSTWVVWINQVAS